ncbi:protein kinase domain-containing protein [Sphingopyxis fribergensis]
MLAAHDRQGPLDTRLSHEKAPPPVYSSLAGGTVIGSFRINRLIGRGGMGEVYLAERADRDFDQRVALKLLRPEAAARFDLFSGERRLLAGLEHPGIARLVDGGLSPDGRPWMAMEFVDGQEINQWCEEQRADIETRLRLFLELCDAVSYAQARLVIHRDIKPANILVDTAGHARLLDFGIARLLDAENAERTMTEALLTPHYAAPEQFDGSPLTVATDIYGLGTILFELLSGCGPWQPDDAKPLPVMFQRLLHDEPPAPSSVARTGFVSRKQISGDLDAIVLKSLRREPRDRYASVEAMARDVRNYLDVKPVAARSGARGYRIRRFLRRNRWGTAAAAAIVLALVVGGIGTWSQAQRAESERDAALAEAEQSEAVNQAMMLMFRDASDAGRTDSITARELIDRTAKRLVSSLDPAAAKSASVVAALSDLYVMTEDIPGAKALLEAATAKRIGQGDPAGTSRIKLRLAQVYAAEKRFAEARSLLAQARMAWSKEPTRFREERVEAASTEAYILRLEGKTDEGIALLQRTMPEAELAYGPKSRDLATRYANLATHLVVANRTGEADAVIRRGMEILKNADMLRSPAGLTLDKLRASLAARDGRIVEAEAIFHRVAATRRQLYGRSISLAVDLLQDGRMHIQLEQPRTALPILEEAQSMATEYLGPKSAPALLAGLARAEAMTMEGRLAEASTMLGSVEPALRALGDGSAEYGSFMLVRSRLALKKGNIPEAQRELQAAEAAFTKAGPTGAGFERSVAALKRQITAQR